MAEADPLDPPRAADALRSHDGTVEERRCGTAATQAAAVAPANADAVRSGACSAWALPMDGECAPLARRIVRQLATDLGLTRDIVDNVLLVASELSTNALQHGGRHVVYRQGRPVAGLPELWAYLRGTAPRELVLTIYDAGPGWSDHDTADESDELRDNGRGLMIVTALASETGGRWDRHPTRARLGERRLPGTATWFALPVPTPPPPAEPTFTAPPPARAIDQLAEQLRARGLHRLITNANGERAVLSVAEGLTVWFRHGSYHWNDSHGPRQQPAIDIVDVTEQIVSENERVRRHHEPGSS